MVPQQRILARPSMGPHHLVAAALLRDRTREVEADPSSFNERPQKKLAYAAAAIVEAYAYVEATINDFFAEALDSVNPNVGYPGLGLQGSPLSLGTQVAKELADAWEAKYEWTDADGSKQKRKTKNLPTMLKYQRALQVLGKQEMDGTTSPFYEVDLVREVRNALMHDAAHFRVAYSSMPNEQADREPWEAALEARAASGEFSLIPSNRPPTPADKEPAFEDADGRLFFPDQLMSASFVHWSILRVLAFVEDFFARLGTKRPGFVVDRSTILPSEFK